MLNIYNNDSLLNDTGEETEEEEIFDGKEEDEGEEDMEPAIYGDDEDEY